MATDERYLAVGKIVGAHGIRGEVKVAILTDYPERFNPGTELFLGSETNSRPVVVVASRPHQQMMLVKLNVAPDRTAAELLAGQLLMIPEGQAMPLAENENYAHDLLGIHVETTAGRALGDITDILATGANDVYVVTGPDGEVLIPALQQVIIGVDLAAQRMIVELPEGLID